MQQSLVLPTDHHLGVPAVSRPHVGHRFRCIDGVLFLRAQLRRPHDEDSDVLIRRLIQPFLLQFGGPPKTDTSGGRGKEDRTDLSGRGVEMTSQGLAVRSDVLNTDRRLSNRW